MKVTKFLSFISLMIIVAFANLALAQVPGPSGTGGAPAILNKVGNCANAQFAPANVGNAKNSQNGGSCNNATGGN